MPYLPCREGDAMNETQFAMCHRFCGSKKIENLNQPCFVSPLSRFPRNFHPKRKRSLALGPRMTLSHFPRRVFLQYFPLIAVAAQTKSSSQEEGTSEELGEQKLPKADIDPSTEEPEITDRAYIDISVNNRPPRRLVIGLYGTIAPKTVANFVSLCENGYADTKVYRIVPGLTVQLGDVLNNNGKSGRAATDSGWLEAETFRIMHSIPGIVSMVTKNGRVDSRFFVATRRGDSGYLDGKYVGFGRVVQGLEFLEEIERAGEGFVRKPVRVVASGVLR